MAKPLSRVTLTDPQAERAAPSVKQHLAAIRMLFDWLVTGQVIPSNPALAVRGPRHSVAKGSTPVLSSEEVRELLAGMDVSSVVGLRDRAIIAVMTYAFARVGAVVAPFGRGLLPPEKALVAPPPSGRPFLISIGWRRIQFHAGLLEF